MGQQHKRCDRPEPRPPAELLRRPEVRRVLGGTLAMFLAYNLFYATFPVHVRAALGWDVGQLGSFFTVLAITMLCAQGPLLGFASRRLRPVVVFAVGIAALAAAFVCYLSHSSAVMYLGAVLYAVGNGLAWPTFQAQVANLAGDADQGAVQGVVTSASSLASIVGLIAGGMLYPWLGSGVFAVGAVLFVAVGLAAPLWFGGGAESAG